MVRKRVKVSGVARVQAFVQFPIHVKKDNGWFIAFCPSFKLAAQGRTREEAEENMKDLLQLYLKDPDTPKPPIKTLINEIMSTTLSSIPLQIIGDMNNVIQTKAITKA